MHPLHGHGVLANTFQPQQLGIGAHSIYELTVGSSSISGYDGFVLFCLSEHLQPVRERRSMEKGNHTAKDLMLQLDISLILSLLFLSETLYRWSPSSHRSKKPPNYLFLTLLLSSASSFSARAVSLHHLARGGVFHLYLRLRALLSFLVSYLAVFVRARVVAGLTWLASVVRWSVRSVVAFERIAGCAD